MGDSEGAFQADRIANKKALGDSRGRARETETKVRVAELVNSVREGLQEAARHSGGPPPISAEIAIPVGLYEVTDTLVAQVPSED